MTSVRDLAELVRAPAALTVPGDTLAGASTSRGAAGIGAALAMPLASTCLYWAGMALNDFADRDLDATERPERPIPSGRISPDTALGVAGVLTAAGIGTATLAGGFPAAATAAVLAGAVWTYDLRVKDGPLGIPTMASTRALDVLLGASAAGFGGLRGALPAAGVMGAHTAAVTALSRGEVRGTSTTVAGAAVVVTFAAAVVSAWSPGARPRDRAISLALATVYAVRVAGAQAAAVRQPDAGSARTATIAGIQGNVPLQAALVAGAGRPRLALGVAALLPVGRWAMKKVSPT